MRWQENQKNGMEWKLRQMFPTGKHGQTYQLLLKDAVRGGQQRTTGLGRTEVCANLGNNRLRGTEGLKARLRGMQREGEVGN